MSDELVTSNEVAKQEPYIRDDGFQIVPNVTKVTIIVRVGSHVSTTEITGFGMEAAMRAEWDGDPSDPSRRGALQFGVRGTQRIKNYTEFNFRSEPDW